MTKRGYRPKKADVATLRDGALLEIIRTAVADAIRTELEGQWLKALEALNGRVDEMEARHARGVEHLELRLAALERVVDSPEGAGDA